MWHCWYNPKQVLPHVFHVMHISKVHIEYVRRSAKANGDCYVHTCETWLPDVHVHISLPLRFLVHGGEFNLDVGALGIRRRLGIRGNGLVLGVRANWHGIGENGIRANCHQLAWNRR